MDILILVLISAFLFLFIRKLNKPDNIDFPNFFPEKHPFPESFAEKMWIYKMRRYCLLGKEIPKETHAFPKSSVVVFHMKNDNVVIKILGKGFECFIIKPDKSVEHVESPDRETGLKDWIKNLDFRGCKK